MNQNYFIAISLFSFCIALGLIAFVVIYNKKIQVKKAAEKVREIAFQKDLLISVIQSKEEEQRRIAQELHDDVGSTVTAIRFSVASLNIDADVKKILNENLGLAIQKIRSISNELLPSILDELGLISAVKSLFQNYENQFKASKEFTCEAVKNPANLKQTKEVELAIYRILQELINNCIKYAEASSIELFIEQDESGIKLILTDNGLGFIPSEHTQKEKASLGLKNIQSRLQQINGEISYEKIYPGTKITLLWKA